MIPGYQVSQPKRSMKRIVALATMLMILALGASLVYAYVKINRPQSSVSVPVSVVVEKGATTSEIADVLKENDLVSSSRLFIAYSLMSGANGKIQAGTYDLNKEMTMMEIVDVLTGGKVSVGNEKRFTIIEGWTTEQIAKQLEQRSIVSAKDFIAALEKNYETKLGTEAASVSYEGYLFPDTYNLHPDWTAEEIVELMLKNTESKFTDQMLSDMEKKGLTIHEVMTMASIVEREVGRTSSVKLTDDVLATMQREREIVASVFYNRLEINMALQSDATVNYVTGKSDRQALYSDLEVDSPYNTYKYTGLPPGPIGNSGIGSIRAAIYPADTDYVYFLSDLSGTAYFAKTLDEHNSNRAKYLD